MAQGKSPRNPLAFASAAEASFIVKTIAKRTPLCSRWVLNLFLVLLEVTSEE